MTKRLVTVALALFTFLVSVSAAAAHPLGNFTINRYSRIEPEAFQVKLRYIVDMAEIPAFQAILDYDTDRDSALKGGEIDRFIQVEGDEIARTLRLTANGRTLELHRTNAELTFPEGQGGLVTLRLVMDYVAPMPGGESVVNLSYHDGSFEGRQGWSEIVVRPGAGVGVVQSSAPDKDLSDELRLYPEDMLSSPVTVRDATFAVQPGGSGFLGPILNPVAPAVNRASDAFADLITAPELAPGVIVVSLLTAVVLGAAHALSPGHGKTIVAAYLVGSKGTAKHALFLGATVTVTHTAGVFALGLVTLFLSRFILPERLFPWLEFISGVIVVIIGVILFRNRLKAAFFPSTSHTHTHEFLPDDEHVKLHAAGGAHDHGNGLLHSHGGGVAHSHDVPETISLRSLFALGVSGGLLPCPSALVVMLSAIALGRVGFGIILIIFFSLGLAGVLTGLGIMLVYAQRVFTRLPSRLTHNPLVRILPIGSAAIITIAGLAITYGALIQTRII